MTEGVRSPTAFVGRTAELTEMRRLVDTERLVTLLGPGGGGKTRLVGEGLPALRARVVGWSSWGRARRARTCGRWYSMPAGSATTPH